MEVGVEQAEGRLFVHPYEGPKTALGTASVVPALRELLATRHDRAGFINLARQRIRDLEQALQADLADTGETRDMGWDVESLRAEFGGVPAPPGPINE